MIVDHSDKVPYPKWPRRFPVPHNPGVAAYSRIAIRVDLDDCEPVLDVPIWVKNSINPTFPARRCSQRRMRPSLSFGLIIFLLIAGLHHVTLGLQALAKDYIHFGARISAMAEIRLTCFAGVVFGGVAVLRIMLMA